MDMLIPIIVLVFSAILHEVMHGFVADRLGDPTPRVAGRLTLNPIPHIDPIGSIFLPLILIFSGSPIIFGSAKPVPVNPIHFKDGKKDLALVALSGPMTNIALALAAAFIIRIFPFASFIHPFLFTVVYINLALGILNLIPIPPLDGSKILIAFLPDRLGLSLLALEPYGIFILFFLLVFPLGNLSLSSLINQFIIYSLKLLGF